MEAKLKADWVKALRSGEYEQGTAMLLTPSGKHCCMGVLCRVMGLGFRADGNVDLPDEIGGYYHKFLPISAEQAEALYHRNDGVGGRSQLSFSEIADYIEQNL